MYGIHTCNTYSLITPNIIRAPLFIIMPFILFKHTDMYIRYVAQKTLRSLRSSQHKARKPLSRALRKCLASLANHSRPQPGHCLANCPSQSGRELFIYVLREAFAPSRAVRKSYSWRHTRLMFAKNSFVKLANTSRTGALAKNREQIARGSQSFLCNVPYMYITCNTWKYMYL